MNTIINPQLDLAYEFVQHTGKNIFLTGKAGTGKTTFLHTLRKSSLKRMIVVAPTGVAAINAGGVTIHSFFQLPFGPILPGEDPFNRESTTSVKRFSKIKIDIIKSLDLLIIDEISMVRADLLDAIDTVLRRFRDRTKPFGGIQLLMIGDLQQLAPVVKDEEWDILKPYYDTMFFFSSRALMKTNYVSIELKHIYRQSDLEFIEILNRVRENNIDKETLQKINQRYIPDFNPDDSENYITLTTRNDTASQKNEKKLESLKTKPYYFEAKVENEFSEYSYPTEFKLTLKVGAQVMFVKNDLSYEKLFYNGKIGVIENISEGIIYVKCQGDESEIPVSPLTWENIKYSLNEQTKEIEEKVIGTFTQYPLKLAWAITIHKSQGLTFEKAIIDARSSFAHGQVYVALSRCKTIEGMVLSSPINYSSVINDDTVKGFTNDIENNPPGQQHLEISKREFQNTIILDLFNFNSLLRKMEYLSSQLKEHQESLLGNPHQKLDEAIGLFKSTIISLSEKFATQIQVTASQNPNCEIVALLQERIIKASVYFIEKLDEGIIASLKSITIETDNKSVRKTISGPQQKVKDEIEMKYSCLESCRNGFDIHKYLSTRAKGSIEKPIPQKDEWKVPEPSDSSIENSELFSRLKNWRNEKVQELDVPHYIIMHQKTLLQLCQQMPCTERELISIKGFSKKKVTTIGAEILDIIIQYRKEKGMEIREMELLPEAAPPKEKINSKLLSFTLHKEGKSIPEIAAERGMAVTTIESHLAHFVGTGEISIHQLVEPSKAEKIAKYFSQSESNHLGPAKEALGDTISYSELKYVLKHLEFNKANIE